MSRQCGEFDLYRFHHGRSVDGLDSLLNGAVDGEDLGQSGNPKDLENTFLRADQAKRAIMSPHPLEAAHEHPESCRVEELNPLHIDDEVVVPGGDEVNKSLPELGSCINVNFATDLDDGAITLSPSGQCQIHESSILACAVSAAGVEHPRGELTGRVDASWRKLSSNRPLDSTTESCRRRRLPHRCARTQHVVQPPALTTGAPCRRNVIPGCNRSRRIQMWSSRHLVGGGCET